MTNLQALAFFFTQGRLVVLLGARLVADFFPHFSYIYHSNLKLTNLSRGSRVTLADIGLVNYPPVIWLNMEHLKLNHEFLDVPANMEAALRARTSNPIQHPELTDLSAYQDAMSQALKEGWTVETLSHMQARMDILCLAAGYETYIHSLKLTAKAPENGWLEY